jgi:seryl-tRNA synthetase
MTTATDTDIQQIKDLITVGNAATQKQISDLAISSQKQIDNLANNTQKQIGDLASSTQKQIDRLFAITEANTKAIDALTKATETNTKTIGDLSSSFSGLREEVRVGFTKVEGEFKTFDEKMKGFDQRISTSEFAKRGITIGVTVTVVGGVLLAFGKILFFGKLI